MVIYTYKTINLINNKYYFGIHYGELDDNYLGSGVALLNAIKKYGKENFKKEIVKIHNSRDEAWEHESLLVTEDVVNDPNSYNMRLGGRGGWEHIDIRGENNPMYRPEVAKKISDAQKKLRKGNERLAEISRQNSIKGAKKLKGRKRPDQAKVMSTVAKKLWKDENFRKIFREKTSDIFTVYSPDGRIFEKIYLSEFCKKHDLPFTTLWNSAQQNGRLIKKGRAKGWKCQQN